MAEQRAEHRAGQRSFRFSPLAGEPVNIARTGLDLDWRRIGRRSRRMLAAHVRQAVDTRSEVLIQAFRLQRHFEDQSLFDELQATSRRQARELWRAARNRGRKLRGSVILACMPEGRRVQAALDYLDVRMNSNREKTSLCG